MRVDETQVVLAAHIAVNAFPIHEYQYIAVAQSVHLHTAAHVALVEGER